MTEIKGKEKIKIIELDEIDSTNEFCKRFSGEEELIVTAKKQTAGKGTKGRSFISDEGGLYVSTLKKYRDFDFSLTFGIMINSCVAVCRTLEKFGLKPQVKWANDVLVNGKKICGTLIENRLGAGNICTSVVGIGLNINNTLPKELEDIATTMSQCRGRKFNVKSVCNELVKNLRKDYTVQDYKAYVDWFGKTVFLDCNGTREEAVALDVDECGNLVCDIGGETRKISSAEMSMRL